MQYLVRYTTPEGVDRYEEVATLEAAIALVERLRNEEGRSDVRMYRQVPLEVRTYYKVVVREGEAPREDEVPRTGEAPHAGMSPVPPGAMPLSPSSPQVASDSGATDVESLDGRRSRFGRG